MDVIKSKYLLLGALIVVYSYTVGQNPVRNTEHIFLVHKSIRIDSLLLSISRQAKVEFSFNASRILASKKLRLHKNVFTVEECLELLKRELQISYRRMGHHIILMEPPKGKTSPTKNNNQPGKQNILLPPVASDPATANLIGRPFRAGDSTRVLSPQTSAAIKIPLVLIINKELHSTPRPLLSSGNAPEHNTPFYERNWFIRGGVGVGDVLYANATMETGIKPLYGILSYSTNFRYQGLRFGVGTGTSLSNGSQLHFRLTFGSLRRTATLVDSTLQLSVKSELYQLHLLYDKPVTRRLSLRVGPVIHLLTTRYRSDDRPFELINPVSRSERSYSILQIPYFIINTYKAFSSSNVKSWVGAELSLLYKIR